MGGLLVEDFLRGNYPLFRNAGSYKRVAKPILDDKRFQQGQMVTLSTRRELYEYYKHWMRVVTRLMAYSMVSGVGAIVCLTNMFSSSNIMWGVGAAVLTGFAAFYYRDSVGKYGKIADYENMPVLVPIVNLNEGEPNAVKEDKVRDAF